MDNQPKYDLKILRSSIFSAAKSGSLGGILFGFILSFLTIIEEASIFDSFDYVFALFLFPYFMSIGAIVGFLMGTILGLIIGIVLMICWPVNPRTLKFSCVFTGGLIGAIFPLVSLLGNIYARIHSEYTEIFAYLFILAFIGGYAGYLGWKSFTKSISLSQIG